MNDFTKEVTKTLLTGGNIHDIFRFHLEKALGPNILVSETTTKQHHWTCVFKLSTF